MKVFEFNEDDYRELLLEERDKIIYKIEKSRVDTLVDFLGYSMKTDGNHVYAITENDAIEIGVIQSEDPID